ncbi:MAG: hypothetical protein RH860_00705 [Cytophagales bacterium]
MYKIEKKDFGFKLTFAGEVGEKELLEWVEKSKVQLENYQNEFGVYVDLTNLKPIQSSDINHFRTGQQLYKDKGMVRSAVILKGAITTLQFREIARKSEIFEGERYIDAEKYPDWENIAVKWVKDGVEPY